MRYFIFFLLLISAVFYVSASFHGSNPKSTFDLTSPIFSAYEKKIAKLRGYTVAGTGVSMPSWEFNYLMMSFKGKEKVDITQARRLYIELVEGLVDAINEDLEFRPYLDPYPATWKNTKIFLDLESKELTDKYISLIFHENGRIYYDVEKQKNKFVTVYDEPYEEALAIVKNEKENGCFN